MTQNLISTFLVFFFAINSVLLLKCINLYIFDPCNVYFQQWQSNKINNRIDNKYVNDSEYVVRSYFYAAFLYTNFDFSLFSGFVHDIYWRTTGDNKGAVNKMRPTLVYAHIRVNNCLYWIKFCLLALNSRHSCFRGCNHHELSRAIRHQTKLTMNNN